MAEAVADLTYELADLADWPLPMDDEPGIPALGSYSRPHTSAWGAKVASADAVMFVTPQYNWGYPAALKNAIDHLYMEWIGKPVMIVTYGGHGGSKCAGQLRQVTEGLKMRPVSIMPAITLSDDMMRSGKLYPERDFQAHADAVREATRELATLLQAFRGTD